MTVLVLLKLDNVSLSLALLCDADVQSHTIAYNCHLTDWTRVIKMNLFEIMNVSVCLDSYYVFLLFA